MTAAHNFIDVWMRNLADSARGLNLNDSEDRATFRGNVRHSMRNAKWDAMRRLATYLGAEKISRSRDAAVRTISALYMQRQSKTPRQLDAEIAEALSKDSG